MHHAFGRNSCTFLVLSQLQIRHNLSLVPRPPSRLRPLRRREGGLGTRLTQSLAVMFYTVCYYRVFGSIVVMKWKVSRPKSKTTKYDGSSLHHSLVSIACKPCIARTIAALPIWPGVLQHMPIIHCRGLDPGYFLQGGANSDACVAGKGEGTLLPLHNLLLQCTGS